MRYIRKALAIYLAVAMPYGLWALLFLSFRTCWESGSCLTTPSPSLKQPLIVAIAAGRGVLWAPNLILSLREGRFVDDWLLFRDVAPMDQLLGTSPAAAQLSRSEDQHEETLRSIGMIQVWLLHCNGHNSNRTDEYVNSIIKAIEFYGETRVITAAGIMRRDYFDKMGAQGFCSSVSKSLEEKEWELGPLRSDGTPVQ